MSQLAPSLTNAQSPAGTRKHLNGLLAGWLFAGLLVADWAVNDLRGNVAHPAFSLDIYALFQAVLASTDRDQAKATGSGGGESARSLPAATPVRINNPRCENPFALG